MSETFRLVIDLVKRGEVKVSDHGYDEMASDDILVRDVLEGAEEAIVVEDYPDYPKGPSVLVLEKDHDHTPIRVVWGIPRGFSSPAVVVTAYRPDASKWTHDFLRRLT
jgi:hypothetical protein